MRSFLLSILAFISLSFSLIAQEHPTEEHPTEEHHEMQAEHHDAGGHGDCSCHHEEEYNPSAVAFHHIADANAFHVFGDLYIPLPCILYAPDQGLSTFLSSAFEFGHHGDGKKAVEGYVLHEGMVMRVADANFPKETVEIECFTSREEEVEGKKKEIYQVIYEGNCYDLDKKTTLDGGILGGGISSYYDFSITKNVFTMLLTTILLLFVFVSVAKAYRNNVGQAPKGLQSLVEPIFLFIRDEVAIPFLGHKYEKYLPFLMTIFFFVLGLNLIGQIPFFPGSGNVTGNLAVTAVLAVFTFLVTNFSGNKHYWEHTLWMPGVPAWIKIILTPVEIMGLFIKPVTLMLRLFANITAGHIVIIIFVSLIFIFGDAGESLSGSIAGGVIAFPLTMFMMSIELLVAFIQAFVFCILSASYISAAIEDPHHH